MKFFKSATEKLFTKEVEYKLHEKVVKDLAEDKKDLGIWGKALVDADGDEQRAKGIYIKLMVQHFKDTAKSEEEIRAIWDENFKREQEAEEERLRQEERDQALALEREKEDEYLNRKEVRERNENSGVTLALLLGFFLLIIWLIFTASFI
jgi:hypothetical protein|tara:strand:- start:129 stop:578 length:450 start_codon:yes stop_codon:yes gene_type:complete